MIIWMYRFLKINVFVMLHSVKTKRLETLSYIEANKRDHIFYCKIWHSTRKRSFYTSQKSVCTRPISQHPVKCLKSPDCVLVNIGLKTVAPTVQTYIRHFNLDQEPCLHHLLNKTPFSFWPVWMVNKNIRLYAHDKNIEKK